MSPTVRVLVGLLSGAALGIALTSLEPALARDAATVAQPIGDLWLNALQMTVVPLVVALVVLGVASTRDAASSGRTARRAIMVFLVLLCAGAAFAADGVDLVDEDDARRDALGLVEQIAHAAGADADEHFDER